MYYTMRLSIKTITRCVFAAAARDVTAQKLLSNYSLSLIEASRETSYY
jgi:hypothetical protein